MRLLITILFSVASLVADNPQPPSTQPKQGAKTRDHSNGVGAGIAPTTRGTTRSVPKGSPTKSIHVRQYTRKDGTVVRAHNRAAPGTASKTKRSPALKKAPSKVAPSRRAK